MDTSQYKALFIQETEEHLKGISEELLHLENETSNNSAGIDNIFRHFHSIKGMAASMGYEGMSSLSHQLEDVLDALRKKRIAVNPEIMEILLSGADTLQTFIKLIAEDKPLGIDCRGLLSRIKAILTREENLAAPLVRHPSGPLRQENNVIPPASSHSVVSKLGLPATMKVDGKIFDNFMGIVGELFTVRSQLKEVVTNSFPVEFQEATHQLGRIVEGLYYAVITARMIPFEDLTQNLPRIVRDMCKKGEKEIELVIQGGDVKLDRAVLEHLTDPLVHIIRNAIDHGIEAPEERKRLGKLAKGRITVAVARQRDNIIIEINDDGKGIDINSLKEKALLSGITKDRLETMSEKDILLLVCMPGLSLAKKITETSGRGVGMDVVKGNIESIGGRLEISTQLNKGTKIILELPVTISIVKVLLVSIGEELFALPISKVLKVLDVNKKDVNNSKQPSCFVYDDIKAPLIDLRSILMLPSLEQRNILPTVIICVKDKISGVVVDDFKGEIDAYIKPLSQPITKMHGIIGVTVLGDGRPVFLIDPAALITAG
ncbi:MAG: chemotaxis protein CheA [Deltaproteobacteria bacterium]|nr:chemotaxis protein CheA [Deltaproteobacteria bacterium]